MPNVLSSSQSNIICGLGTYTHTVGPTGGGNYRVVAHSEESPPSSVSIVISQTGSASNSVTSTAPAAGQGHIEVQALFNVVAGDVLTVAITSAAAIDNQLNTVKTIVSMGRI